MAKGHDGSISWSKAKKRWYARVTAKTGKQVGIYLKTHAEAKVELKKLLSKKEEGIALVKASTHMNVHLREWLEMIRPKLQESTYEGYAIMVNNYLIPILGKYRLNKISPEDINDGWEKMRKHRKENGKLISESIIEHCHARLATFLIYAMKRKWRNDNPLAFVTKPKAKKKIARAFSKQETATILNTAKTEFNGDYYAIIHTALHTGLRRNELLAITWRDVDVDLGTISVNKSIDRRRSKTTIKRPKTDEGIRLVTLPPASSLLLRELRQQQEVYALLFGYKVDADTNVFIRQNGKPLLPRAVSNGFKVIAERAGYPDLQYHFHESRHTHATLMLEQGVHAKIVQERLGHKDIETTLNTYSHVSTTIQKEASDKFDLPLDLPMERTAKKPD
ncbi:site-specific integrase [SAR202 cluster bacterium AC-647-N09_OGT_505m]|nr:site-specific integrase [SAR202 cluster bacterium AC-647-N09_OGT_505m]